jgi:hypothetical protein
MSEPEQPPGGLNQRPIGVSHMEFEAADIVGRLCRNESSSAVINDATKSATLSGYVRAEELI